MPSVQCSLCWYAVMVCDTLPTNTSRPHSPGVGDADDMVHISEDDFQELVGDDRAGVGKTKQGVVGEDSMYARSTRMENAFVAQSTESLQ